MTKALQLLYDILLFLAVIEDKSEQEDEEKENDVAEDDEDEGIISIFIISRIWM